MEWCSSISAKTGESCKAQLTAPSREVAGRHLVLVTSSASTPPLAGNAGTPTTWVNVRFEARLQNCRVVGVDVSSENELYKLPAALADLIGGVMNAARGGTVLAGMPGCD